MLSFQYTLKPRSGDPNRYLYCKLFTSDIYFSVLFCTGMGLNV